MVKMVNMWLANYKGVHSIFEVLDHLYYRCSEFLFRAKTTFQVVCLFPLCLFGLVSFYTRVYLVLFLHLCNISLPFHFFLTFCGWGLLFPGFKVVFLLPFGLCPVTQRSQTGALWHRLWSHPERCDGVGNGREAQEVEYMCIPVADPCWCMAETNTIL